MIIEISFLKKFDNINYVERLLLSHSSTFFGKLFGMNRINIFLLIKIHMSLGLK